MCGNRAGAVLLSAGPTSPPPAVQPRGRRPPVPPVTCWSACAQSRPLARPQPWGCRFRAWSTVFRSCHPPARPDALAGILCFNPTSFDLPALLKVLSLPGLGVPGIQLVWWA